jgi:hypothetical protein
MKLVIGIVVSVVLVVAAIALAGPEPTDEAGRQFDQDLARLLVKLELRTRAVIAKHYVSADDPHREWLARNLLLPAAVADNVFHEVVPEATEGRAWVKMIVDEPRNPNNVGDDVTLALLNELRAGEPRAERSTDDAYYYGEPISAAKGCLTCHGGPRGEPDPFFPEYEKNGWQEGEVVGAVVARVAR